MEQWKLPENWEWVKVKNITETIKTVDPAKIGRDSFIYIEISSIDSSRGAVDISQLSPIPVNSAPSRARKPIKKDDVIFATTRHYLKNIALIPEELDDQICSTGFCVLRAQKQLVLPKYIYFAVRSDFFIEQLTPKQRGANYPAVADSDVFDSEIPIPFPNDPARSLETQKRIVLRLETLLGEVKSARELQESIEEETNLLIDSVLTEIFASRDQWQNEKPLDELVSIEASLVDPREPEYSKLPHIYGASIEGGTGRLLDYQSAAEDGMTSNKYLFEPGVVLYSKIRPYLRKVTIADFKGVCSADMYPLTVTSDAILPEFLMWTLLSPEFTEFINAFSLRARIPKVNREQLMAYRMRYPDINSQKKIAAYIQNWRDEVSEMQRAQRENAALLEQTEQSLLAQAFRGEL